VTYMLTIKDLENRDEGAYYTGPLDVAKDFIRHYCNVSVVFIPGKNVTVYIDQSGSEKVPDWNTCDEFGNGATEEIAWRWALGAAFGPADDEFSAFPLTHNKQEAIEVMVAHHFPERLDEFYSPTTGLAAVEDKDGNMWRVWPDGNIEVYRR